MKIKTRKKLMSEYNSKYPLELRDYSPNKSLQHYFDENNLNYTKAVTKAKKKLDKILSDREYESIHIIMYEYPTKTHRPRTTKFGNIYSPNAADNHSYFTKSIKTILKNINKTISLINTPAEITIDAYLEMPKQIKPDEVILFESKVLNVIDTPDYDNIGKAYTDMLKDVLITDDDIFYSGTINKWYSVIPRVEFTITYLKSHESDYIYNKIKSRKTIKEGISNGTIILNKPDYR